jgi:hypothetical protein
MKTKVIASVELEMDALTLMDFLGDTIGKDHDMVCVYVQDDEGRTFEKVKLVEETLTDGSKVHNLILS